MSHALKPASKFTTLAEIQTKEGLEWFRAAMHAETQRVTRTRETAIADLHKRGFLTKSGKLAKAYGGE